MVETCDVIVVGLGGFGSAAACELARRGLSVIGLEQFDAGHARGSSHGETRIIRRAYFEHPDYVPLLDETYRMWRELESESGKSLVDLCGLVLAGPEDGEAIPGVRLARDQHGVEIEELDAAEASARFPQIRFDESHVILGELDAGYLRVDDCVRVHSERAAAHGARLRFEEPVIDWSATPDGVAVRTGQAEYQAGQLVVAAGAWAGAMLQRLGIAFNVIRKPVLWFPKSDASSEGWPVFYVEDAARSFYGLPGLDGATVKIAEHSGGDRVSDPHAVDRAMRAEDSAPVAQFAASSLNGVDSSPIRHSVCMYTMSPDGHFVVDRHPEHENVAMAAGFSGHGFKFTPVIGRAIADLVETGRTSLPVGFLSAGRFHD